MVNSLTNTLKIVTPHLNTNLVSSETSDCFDRVTNLLPNIPSVSEVIFESHLGSSSFKTDFQAAFNTLSSGRKASVDCCKPLVNTPCANSVWNRIQDFCLHWADEKSLLYENVANIWLEFDIDDKPSKIPQPSFFFTPNLKNLRVKENNPFSTHNISTKHCVVNKALKLLLGNSLPNQVEEKLLTCFNLLPSNGEISHIGVMLPRPSESKAVRLVLQGLSREQLIAYLSNIGWPGSFARLNSTLSKLSNFADDIRIQFSVEDVIYPKIGIECYFNRQPKNSLKCQSFLAFLVENQLCTLEKADSLLDWPGYLEKRFSPELWSESLTKASTFVDPILRSAFVRLLNHIKIVYEPDRPLQAKAYLSLTHRWLDSNGHFKQ